MERDKDGYYWYRGYKIEGSVCNYERVNGAYEYSIIVHYGDFWQRDISITGNTIELTYRRCNFRLTRRDVGFQDYRSIFIFDGMNILDYCFSRNRMCGS